MADPIYLYRRDGAVGHPLLVGAIAPGSVLGAGGDPQHDLSLTARLCTELHAEIRIIDAQLPIVVSGNGSSRGVWVIETDRGDILLEGLTAECLERAVPVDDVKHGPVMWVKSECVVLAPRASTVHWLGPGSPPVQVAKGAILFHDGLAWIGPVQSSIASAGPSLSASVGSVRHERSFTLPRGLPASPYLREVRRRLLEVGTRYAEGHGVRSRTTKTPVFITFVSEDADSIAGLDSQVLRPPSALGARVAQSQSIPEFAADLISRCQTGLVLEHVVVSERGGKWRPSCVAAARMDRGAIVVVRNLNGDHVQAGSPIGFVEFDAVMAAELSSIAALLQPPEWGTAQSDPCSSLDPVTSESDDQLSEDEWGRVTEFIDGTSDATWEVVQSYVLSARFRATTSPLDSFRDRQGRRHRAIRTLAHLASMFWPYMDAPDGTRMVFWIDALDDRQGSRTLVMSSQATRLVARGLWELINEPITHGKSVELVNKWLYTLSDLAERFRARGLQVDSTQAISAARTLFEANP